MRALHIPYAACLNLLFFFLIHWSACLNVLAGFVPLCTFVPNSHVLGVLHDFLHVPSSQFTCVRNSASSQDWWMPVTCACVRISVRSQICGRLSLASRGITRACFISSCKVPVRGCSFTCVEMNHSCMFQFFPPCLNAQLP